MSIRSIKSVGRVAAAILLAQMIAISCGWAQPSKVTETKLDNGLTVLMKEVHAAPVFTAQVWFKVGSRNEHTGITGVSHLLEHMLFNSSKNFKKGEISDMIRKRGGIENAGTWTDFTYYWQLLSSDNLEFSMKTLAERVENAQLLNKEFQNERTVVLSELQGHENDPDRLIYNALMEAAFTAHPYNWPTIGWESDVRNVDIQQLKNYYKTYYFPNNATLVLVGDFDSKKAMGLITKYFGSKPAGKLPRPMYTTEPPQRGAREVIVRREGNSERVLLGYHIPATNNPDIYPLMVMDQILSGGRSGRLYQALVEKQLATSAWSSPDNRKDPGLFTMGATARQGVTSEKLQKALLEQVEVAKNTLPTEQEMQAAKNQLEAYLIFQNDSVSDQGEQLGYYNTIISWKYLDTLIPRIKAVTPEQVKEVANKYLLPDNLTVAKFIPTSPSTGGNGGGPGIGPVHRSKSPASKLDLARYTGATPIAAASAVKTKNVNNSIKPTRAVLDNGMVVIVQENHSNPTVAVTGYIKAGGYFNPEGKKGVASLTAEMLGRGTQSRSALDLARATEFVGASVGASADEEAVRFGAKSLAKDFSLVLDVLSDELRNASFPEEQFEKAKGEMLSDLEQSKESPDAQAARAFNHAVFPAGHPYHELTFDEAEKELQNITRNDLVSFHKEYYRPDTAIIVIAGDVKAQDAIESVKKYFADWKAEGPTPKMEIKTIQPQTQPQQVVIPMPDRSEVSVLFGHAMGLKRTDPEFYAVRVMNQILGGGGAMGSIMGDQIREQQGLVYDVRSEFDATLGAGPWYASLGTAPKNADKAIKALQNLTRDFIKTGATKKQFEQAREYIIGVLPIAMETNEGVARTLLNAEFYGLGMDYVKNFAKIYRAVTLAQVNAAAKKYLHPDAATLVIAGPYNSK